MSYFNWLGQENLTKYVLIHCMRASIIFFFTGRGGGGKGMTVFAEGMVVRGLTLCYLISLNMTNVHIIIFPK